MSLMNAAERAAATRRAAQINAARRKPDPSLTKLKA